jgi:hypothetical protein
MNLKEGGLIGEFHSANKRKRNAEEFKRTHFSVGGSVGKF